MPAAISDPEDRGRWSALALLSVAIIFSMSAWFSAAAVLPQLRREWNLSPSVSAWLTIAVQLGFTLGALASSALNLSDIVKPRLVILGGSLGAAAANLLLLFAGGFGPGVVLRLATGFFLAGVYPPAMKLMSTWFRRDRGLALGILIGAIGVGNALPHLINGLGGLHWQVVIVATTFLTICGGFIASLAVRDGPYPFPAATFDPTQVWHIFANRGVRMAVLGYFGHMWELFAMYAWFLIYFSSSLAAQGAVGGSGPAFATFAVIAVGGIGAWLGGILADRWGRTRTTALSMALSGTCALVIGLFFHAPSWLLLTVALIWGVVVVSDSAQFSAMVTELADQAYVGTALTLQTALGFALTAVTIWLIPLAASGAGWQWVFALLAPGPAIGVWLMLRLKSLPEAARLAGGKG